MWGARCAVAALFLTASFPAAGAGAKDEFSLVPAKLWSPRDGLGNVFARLKAGERVRVAYLGGSITAQNGWRVKTLQWLQQRYPHAKLEEINAAIGGTGSDLGVFRFQHDVLRYQPNLVFVEFSVNDGGTEPAAICRAMEGIVRQAWRHDPALDLCFVYTFRVGYEKDLDRGFCPRAASAHELLAEHYGIPSINMALRTAELAREGRLFYTPPQDAQGKALPLPPGAVLFSNDGVHPLDAGHDVYLQVIAEALTAMEPTSRPQPHTLKAPLMPDNWEKAKLVPLRPSMLTPGWKKLDPGVGLGRQFANRLPELWEATQPGERLTFRFRGTVAKLYDVMGPDGGQVVCTLDGRAGPPRPRFDSYCTYWRLASLTLGQDLEDGVHTVVVEVHPEQPDRSVVIDREKDKPGFDPAKYQGTAVRVGFLMLVGDLLE
ncbi:MAG: SGNH/GDSL hydrolase family protein [Armatimonadota bacterium]|nr:SGNH/GDSL hydrolase family protein [Armatimonadota bacterium]